MYWPYSFREAADLGLDFFGAINVGLGKENTIRYTVHPMDFIKNNRFLGSAPEEVSIAVETKKDPIVLSSEIVADASVPNSEHIVSPIAIAEIIPPVSNTIENVSVEETPIETTIIAQPEPTVSAQTEVVATEPTILTPEKIVEITDTLPSFIPDSERIFSDIPKNSPFYSATKYLFEAGVTHGYEDGGFYPDDWISRSETILLYDRLFKNDETTANISLPFVDILSSSELGQALKKAFARKIVAKNNRFRPNDSLTRAEAITLLIRTSGIPLATEKFSLFKDIKANNSHRVYINTFAKYLGLKGQNFEPNKAITR